MNYVTDTSSGNFTVTASLSSSCSQTITGVSASDGLWHGVVGVADPSCITAINPAATYNGSLPQSKYPVAFGFHANGTQASTVFCYAFQYEKTGLATYNLTTNALNDVEEMVIVPSSPFQDFVYNG